MSSSLMMYSSPNRYYHNFSHIAGMLSGLDNLFPDFSWNMNLRMAITYHDCHYEPGNPANELESAMAAVVELEGLVEDGVTLDVTEIARLILLTKNHRTYDGDTLGSIIIDLDLAGLGFNNSQYIENSKKIRKEFSKVDQKTWLAGRAEFLKGFLERPAIYYTKYGKENWEDVARENMAAELEYVLACSKELESLCNTR